MKMNRTLVLAIASVLIILLILLIPVQAAQATGPILAIVLAAAWAGYFVWRGTQKGWSSPPTETQGGRAILSFNAAQPAVQVLAAIPALVYEHPNLAARRRHTRGMLIVSAQGLYVHGPKVGFNLHIPHQDVDAMAVVEARMDGIGNAPSVFITTKSGTEWLAVSETGHEGAELIAKWGERAYGR